MVCGDHVPPVWTVDAWLVEGEQRTTMVCDVFEMNNARYGHRMYKSGAIALKIEVSLKNVLSALLGSKKNVPGYSIGMLLLVANRR